MAKGKYSVGRMIPQRWAFGMFDRETKVGVLCIVPNRRQETLFPLIEQYIRPGSIIHSDEYSVYVNQHTQTSHITNIAVNPPYQHIWV